MRLRRPNFWQQTSAVFKKINHLLCCEWLFFSEKKAAWGTHWNLIHQNRRGSTSFPQDPINATLLDKHHCSLYRSGNIGKASEFPKHKHGVRPLIDPELALAVRVIWACGLQTYSIADADCAIYLSTANEIVFDDENRSEWQQQGVVYIFASSSSFSWRVFSMLEFFEWGQLGQQFNNVRAQANMASIFNEKMNFE